MKKLNLTIGIPAYNEENNIAILLKSLLSQKTDNFTLKYIYVAVDGASDNTANIAKKVSKKDKRIHVLNSNIRLGKIGELNMLYEKSNTDIYLTIDGDMTLKTNNVLNEIMNCFQDEKVSLVGANVLTLTETSFFGKIVTAWLYIWQDIKQNYKNGNTIHNHLGCASAMRKELYKKIHIPETLGSDEDYIYIYSQKNGYKFKFADNAKIYFKAVSNIFEFYNQHGRFLSLKDNLANYFGDEVYSYYAVPFKNKVNSIFKALFSNPFYTILGIILQISLLIKLKTCSSKVESKFWDSALSSKKIN